MCPPQSRTDSRGDGCPCFMRSRFKTARPVDDPSNLMGAASEIQGSPQWQGTVLLCSALWILISMLRGWTTGLMRQLTAIVAFLVAAFLVLHFTSHLAGYLHREVPQVLQTAVAALLIWITSYSGILLIGRILFKRTRDQDSLLMRIIYGAGGALLGF